MTPTPKEETRQAAERLIEAGFHISIPGEYTIHTADDAAAFVEDPEAYYRMLYVEAGERETQDLREKAQEVGAEFEDFIHYYEYYHPYRILQWRENLAGRSGRGVDAPGLPYCFGVTKTGERCRRTAIRSNIPFSDFRKGIHDRCPLHQDAEAKR